jgi:hypothetical protein
MAQCGESEHEHHARHGRKSEKTARRVIIAEVQQFDLKKKKTEDRDQSQQKMCCFYVTFQHENEPRKKESGLTTAL